MFNDEPAKRTLIQYRLVRKHENSIATIEHERTSCQSLRVTRLAHMEEVKRGRKVDCGSGVVQAEYCGGQDGVQEEAREAGRYSGVIVVIYFSTDAAAARLRTRPILVLVLVLATTLTASSTWDVDVNFRAPR
jgi:hypothetical protein